MAGVAAVAALALGSAAYADDVAPAMEGEIQRLQDLVGRAPAVQDELQRLQDLVGRGSEELERQAQQLEEQRRALEAQRRRLEELEAQIYGTPQPRAQPALYPAVPPMRKHLRWGPRRAQAQPGEKPPAAGERPQDKERRRPEVAVIAERGGILTRRGTLVVEPSLQLSHSSRNRFIVQGVLTAGAVLIGIVEATDADRNSARPAITGRYGITDRLEVEGKVPFVYRDERIKNEIITDPPTSEERNIENANIGDVEFAGHYQINRGRGGWPFFIGNLQVKTTTGEGPFDVERDVTGIETESTTGSGFWAVEPSVTVILPSDPAVFFANVGYVLNLERAIDQIIETRRVGDVDPGDAVKGSFGFGFAINERTSFSLGYKHTFIGETVSEVTTDVGGPLESTAEVRSVELHVGAILLGLSYRLTDDTSVHVNLEGGLTEDAPDVIVTIRVPMSFDLK